MHNILLVAVRLGSEAAAWRGSEKYVILLYDKKSLDKFQQRSHFLVKTQFTGLHVDKNELVHGDFSLILIGNFS